MPRQARLKLARHPWHVWQRGVNRACSFGTDVDRLLYLALLRKHSRATGCAVHAYVLMSNHVHLLVTPDGDHCVSAMMKAVGETYVRAFNKAHKRSGTLWEGRFKSSIIETDRYLMACQRYIELNPVRAGMVSHPAQYEWSSYRVNAAGSWSDLLTPHDLYLSMGPDQDRRAACYRRLFEAPVSEEDILAIRQAAAGGFALGGPIHQCRVESHAGRRSQRLRRSYVDGRA